MRNRTPVIRDFGVIGLGRFGSSVARRLEENGKHVLGIDPRMEMVRDLSDEITQAISLDPTDPDALQEAGIAAFDTVIVAMSYDFELTLLTATSLKSLGVRRVICQADTVRQREILLKLGVDHVIRPHQDAGQRLADELSTPNVMDTIELDEQQRIVALHVPASLVGRTVEDCEFQEKHHTHLLAVKRGSDVLHPPNPDLQLVTGDVLVVLGNERDIRRLGESA